jgi:peptidoglycan/xylan/chitin deacetylase (PgdA/CDA1 family)
MLLVMNKRGGLIGRRLGYTWNCRARRVTLAALLVGALAGAAGACPVPEGARHVPVLTYHEIVERDQDVKNGAMISVREFRNHMVWLKNNGFGTITCWDLQEFLLKGKRLPPNSVLIIFDDGYESVYTRAFPVMRSLRMRFAIAIIGRLVGTETRDGLRHLTVDQVREMCASGLVEVQSHGFDCHEDSTAATVEHLRRDFETFDALVRSWGVEPPHSFVYPYGRVTADLKAAVAGHGYLMAFTTARRAVTRTPDSIQLPRIVIFPGTDTSILQKALRPPG